MGKPLPLLNRELSWMEFNSRVLGEARDPSVPILERLKFLAISSSNLDEFFMVRVGGLQLLRAEGKNITSPDGRSTRQQLAELAERTHQLVAEQYDCLLDELEPRLAAIGVQRTTVVALTPKQHEHLQRIFTHDIYPVLTPVAVEASEQFPLLPGLMLHLLVRLKPPPGQPRRSRFAVLGVPRTLARFIPVSDAATSTYIPIENVIAAFVGQFFPGEPVLECVPFRVTRNADMELREDQAGDLLAQMKEILNARKTSACVRVEVAEGGSRLALAFLRKALTLRPDQVYRVPGPIDLTAYRALANLPGQEAHRDPAWPPQEPPDVPPGVSMVELIARKDILLVHPYQSFEPVVRLIEQAAADPAVLAIKQILYRTNENSRIIAALTSAALRGKQVTALVELKARFDEARNIEWAHALEKAGAQVIYGLKYLKVHAKVCIIVRREATGIRRYCHFSTGNYNEVTAKLYSDVGLMTCNEDCAADATAFFYALTGYSQPIKYRKLAAAPHTLRPRLLDLIESEIERRKQGQDARIVAKLNALVHQELIAALYRASQAGVQVELNIRGICCLRPGVPGLSENIRVVSVVDRFLEHARIMYFHQGGEPLVFISSADWMPRNLDRRVELLVPVEDPEFRRQLIATLETSLRDNVKAHRLLPDGGYERVQPARGEKSIRSQEIFYRQAREAAQQARQNLYMVFQPQLPGGTTAK